MPLQSMVTHICSSVCPSSVKLHIRSHTLGVHAGAELVEALGALHEAKIIHRDVTHVCLSFPI